MTTYEAIVVALQSNIVLIGVLSLIIVIVKDRKK
ncbi:putative holin-like toxin [Anaerobacillus isosaccharinicus]|uniref:Holin-like toxin n=1 Tax=Anaerobacillus isosaccharinicus TaxID=1532552 RepID=A0AC62A4I9_9BACI|nr:putative holin-like toxin [Anaerobacillus isosaccharinicus]